MKNIILSGVAALALGGFMTSCDDFLTVNPSDKPVLETFYTTPENLRSTTMTLYASKTWSNFHMNFQWKMDMINGEPEYDAWYAFTVQEEVGTRGAKAAAFTIEPDIAVVLETTTACDIAETSGAKRVCELGKGCVVSYMDRATIYDRELYQLARSTADKLGIANQTKTLIAGGNDSGAIHVSRGGVRTCALSVPCRYLHSPACVINEADYTATAKLAEAVLTAFAEL